MQGQPLKRRGNAGSAKMHLVCNDNDISACNLFWKSVHRFSREMELRQPLS